MVGDLHRAGMVNRKTVKAALQLEEDRELVWREAQRRSVRLLPSWLKINDFLTRGGELVFEKWKKLSRPRARGNHCAFALDLMAGLGDNQYARSGLPGFDDPLGFKDLNAPLPRKIDQRAHRGFRVQDCAAWIIDTISESAAVELRESGAGLPAVELFVFEPQRSHRFI